ncbi:helix-turn-helix domain-containing protein [Flavobacterium sp. 1355]|uniref:helix-turn-helix domain-containing protein n=1 Tax=Flavobacterium sp. 1355 TaxID=2806571 RepID=UPI001B511D81|nr:helix-turn-helix transcriptional regulator [Flavobacterium sp. 1355]MBP1224992.1 transcriptional regulator with XRE-family HTH domain [Flavobacterium sp. 1355]
MTNLLADSMTFVFVTRDKLKKDIGLRIIKLREQKGWSQSDLARACNKDRQAIEKLENGKVNPTLYTLLEIASALEISLSKLVDLS